MMATTAPIDPVARELFDEIARWPIFDPHSHIDAHRPAARNLDEILGYHYYTELAHSAGMPARPGRSRTYPQERARNLAGYLDRIDNTVQHSWLMEIVRTFHGFGHDRITPETIDSLYDRKPTAKPNGTAWDHEVWDRSKLEAVFLTNDFDDPLEGFDTRRYVPCLRTDDLVLKLHEPRPSSGFERSTGIDVVDYSSLRQAIGATFERFVKKGAKACAISLPPDFAPRYLDPQESRHADPQGLAPDGLPPRRARGGPPGRLLDDRRVLRRVPASL